MGSKLCETFAFDNLDRIDYSQRNGVTNVDVAYDALGNVTSKSDVGSYTYDATKIHAVTAAGSNSYAYDANGNMTIRNGSTVTWFSYDLPMRIYAPGSVTYLQYGPDRSLWRQEATTSGVTETTTYVGEVVEKVTKDGVTTWKHYVEASTGTAAVYLRRSGGTPAAETYYLTHDHLGSTDKVLNASGGVVTVAESFTALGARRGSTWQGTPTPAELAAIAATTRDGFTGHETLDSVGLVHMGGRVYDPVVGRFLSVDPVVRDIGAAQSWNSYGYVEGRVVSWIDPTGWQASPARIKNAKPRDLPHSGWVTSVYGTFHQRGEWRVDPDTDLAGELITTGYWTFNGPASFVGFREPSLGLGDVSARSEGPSEGAEAPVRETAPPVEPSPTPCPASDDESRTNNPDLNRNVAVGASIGFTVFAIVGVAIIGFPESEPLVWLALMDALAGEPIATAIVVATSAGAHGAVAGGSTGYLFTPPEPPTCP